MFSCAAILLASFANFTGDHVPLLVDANLISTWPLIKDMKKAFLGASKRMRGDKSKSKSTLDDRKEGSVTSSKDQLNGIVQEVEVLEVNIKMREQAKDQNDDARTVVSVASGVMPSLPKEERKRRKRTVHAPVAPSEIVTIRNGDEDIRMSRSEKKKSSSVEKGKMTSDVKVSRAATKRKLPSDYSSSIVVQIIDSPKQQRHSSIISRCYELVFCA